MELLRRSKRLNKNPPKAGTPSRSARKKHKDAESKEEKEGGRSVKSSSEEWHSEEENIDSETDIENDDERGNGDDGVSPVGVGKPHQGLQIPEVSVLTQY